MHSIIIVTGARIATSSVLEVAVNEIETKKSELICQPIGVIRSPLKQQNDSPIQPKFGEEIEGSVEVDSAYAEGLRDLEDCERIWLLTWLHRSGQARMMVVPYRDTVERGLFSTRAPSRPNPIGLHCVKLLRIKDNVLQIAELDILDGTPVLDIKPYSPEIDSYPDAKAGWWDNVATERQRADDRFQG